MRQKKLFSCYSSSTFHEKINWFFGKEVNNPDCFCTMICMYVRFFFLRLRYVCRNIKLTYDIARLIASFSRWSIVL